MAHQQDRPVGAVADGRGDRIAVGRVGGDLARDAVLAEEAADMAADRVDPGLVVGTAVGVHQPLEQRHHRGVLTPEPVEDLAFVTVGCSAHTPTLKTMMAGTSPAMASLACGSSGRR